VVENGGKIAQASGQEIEMVAGQRREANRSELLFALSALLPAGQLGRGARHVKRRAEELASQPDSLLK